LLSIVSLSPTVELFVQI